MHIGCWETLRVAAAEKARQVGKIEASSASTSSTPAPLPGGRPLSGSSAARPFVPVFSSVEGVRAANINHAALATGVSAIRAKFLATGSTRDWPSPLGDGVAALTAHPSPKEVASPLVDGGSTTGHPFRKLAPVRGKYTRGSKAHLDRCSDEEALRQFQAAKFALTTRLPRLARERWWYARCQTRGIHPLPITIDKLELAGALLKAGGYRSGALYLTAMKHLHVKAQHEWTQQHCLAYKDAVRSLERGLGPARRADEFPVDELADPSARGRIESVRAPSWPAARVDAIIISAAWLLREIESSSACLQAVTVHEPTQESEGCGWVEWHFPASKTDARALGATRALGCACPTPLCPVAAMRRVCSVSRSVASGVGRASLVDWPLIVKSNGRPMEKYDITGFYKQVAKVVGHGSAHITGHSA